MNVFVSENGTDYVKVDSVIRVFDPFSCKSSKELLEIKTPCVGRYIKVIGVNEIIPEGLVGAGKMPGIFCDEIFVR
jgi:hypothetical protein